MDFPAVQLLCLEQKDHSLEDHTRDFLDLACLTHFLDRSLCFFFTSPAWASSVRHACQRTVPKRKISPLSWSGCLRTIDLHSLSAPQMRIYPAPLPNHRPASRHPVARSYCLSPLQTESLPELIGRDLLSQANCTVWHPRPELWALHVWSLNMSLSASQSES